MSTPATVRAGKTTGEVRAHDHEARLSGAQQAEARLTSCRTDGPACRGHRKLPDSSGVDSNKSVIWGIPVRAVILLNISDLGIKVTAEMSEARKRWRHFETVANRTIVGKMRRRFRIGKWQAIVLKARREVEARRKAPRTPAAYEYRLVLFLDFLGFKELVQQSVADATLLNDLLETIDIVGEIGDGHETTPQANNLLNSLTRW